MYTVNCRGIEQYAQACRSVAGKLSDLVSELEHFSDRDGRPGPGIREREEIDRQIRRLKMAAEKMNEAVVIYRNTEKRIAAIYENDVYPFQKTVFGRSSFENLEQHAELIQVRRME